MKRVPVVATLVVALPVALMIALGLWQLLIRLPAKDAQIAQLAQNPAKPPVAFPLAPDDSLLFRRTHATCARVTGIDRAGAGNAGYRLIAHCAAGKGTDFLVQLGTTHDPKSTVQWLGGAVTGWVSHAPDATPLIESLVRPRPRTLLLVADHPAPGLAANTRPDVGLVPNNHFSYAIQWFLFAGVASVIYGIALRARVRRG